MEEAGAVVTKPVADCVVMLDRRRLRRKGYNMALQNTPRKAVGIGLALTLLSGCGAVQTASLASNPPSLAGNAQIREQNHRGKMILRTSRNEALIYATGGCGGTCVFSYPQGTLVGSLSVGSGPTQIGGDCADKSGNVFIANDSELVEYSHGGTQPIATFELPGRAAIGCSVDPPTNDVAVVFSGTGSNVAIFHNGSGSPETFDSGIGSFYCGYDGQGDLFVDGNNGQHAALAELPSGQKNFVNISVDLPGVPGQLQWDGKYITYQDRSLGEVAVSRLSVSGTTATVVGVTKFKIGKNSAQSWIYQNRIFIPYDNRGATGHQTKVGVWRYPKGGKPLKSIEMPGNNKKSVNFQGVALSPPA